LSPAGNTSALIPIISDLASVSGTGGGGGGGGLSSIASAILVSDGSAVDVNIGGTPEDKSFLMLNTENASFDYAKVAFQLQGDLISPIFENLTLDMGGGTDRSFITSGSTKTIQEFDDKSRVALGRNSVPLEISAFGESDVRLRSDNTNGAFVLVEGTDAAPSLVHLKSTALSADAASTVTFASDITVATSSVANTFAGLSAAIAAGGGGTTIELLSAGFSGTGSIPTTAGALLTWDTPGLNTASVTYAAGEFTIPAGLNGYYCEVNAMAGGNGGTARVELNFELQKDTGGGYATVAAGDNYAVRTTTQDEGGAWINFLDPTAVATGDKYKFTFRRVGGGLNHKPTATKLAMKFYSP